MPERDIMGALDYLRALTEYIEALERVRVHARLLAETILALGPDDLPGLRDSLETLLERIRMVDDANPVMRCGS